jgi:hypothetical protein
MPERAANAGNRDPGYLGRLRLSGYAGAGFRPSERVLAGVFVMVMAGGMCWKG